MRINMDFINGIEAKEEAIIKLLRVQQSGIDNRTGKGSGVGVLLRRNYCVLTFQEILIFARDRLLAQISWINNLPQ